MSESTERLILNLREAADAHLERAFAQTAETLVSTAWLAWTTKASDGQLLRAMAESSYGSKEMPEEVVNNSQIDKAVLQAVRVVVGALNKAYAVQPEKRGFGS